MKEIAISLSDVAFSYEEQKIIEGVDLEIEGGKFFGIVGPNGGGKTTFLKLLMGFLTPSRGTILLFGKPPTQSRKKIGYVPQIYRADRDFPITVKELISLGSLSHCFFLPPEIKRRREELMEELGLLPYSETPFSHLSGGFAQRALLARALLSDPDLILLDEPMANVDASSCAAIFNLLQRGKGKKTILLVTHDLPTVVEQVDGVLCIDRHVTFFQPGEVCEHFALGLYHTPLLGLPKNHFQQKDVPVCSR